MISADFLSYQRNCVFGLLLAFVFLLASITLWLFHKFNTLILPKRLRNRPIRFLALPIVFFFCKKEDIQYLVYFSHHITILRSVFILRDYLLCALTFRYEICRGGYLSWAFRLPSTRTHKYWIKCPKGLLYRLLMSPLSNQMDIILLFTLKE